MSFTVFLLDLLYLLCMSCLTILFPCPSSPGPAGALLRVVQAWAPVVIRVTVCHGQSVCRQSDKSPDIMAIDLTNAFNASQVFKMRQNAFKSRDKNTIHHQTEWNWNPMELQCSLHLPYVPSFQVVQILVTTMVTDGTYVEGQAAQHQIYCVC